MTLFGYLNSVDPNHGGQTDFRYLNLSVPAVKNNAVFWYLSEN